MARSHPKDFVRTWIEIDSRSLFSNFDYFRRRARGARMMAMIKSNAYGHGLVAIATLLAGKYRDVWFGVDSITEAARLREEGIERPILVLGYTVPRRLPEAAKKDVAVTISHFEGLRDLGVLRRRPRFHLKLDTGMHRQGFQARDVPLLVHEIKKYSLRPEGVYSHLSTASNRAVSRGQIRAFEAMLAVLRGAGVTPPIVHFDKTEGIVKFPEARYHMVRLGIGLYGYYPGRGLRLRPVATWKTIVSEVKRVSRGECVSYDRTECLTRDSTIAILPVGYWHGFDRGLSSRGEALIKGRRAKVLGRVTMDMIMVDATQIPGVRVGDEAVLIGSQGRERITADDVAKRLSTVSYEVLTRINPLIRKVIL